MAISDLQFRIVDQRLVIVDGSFDLMHQRALRVNLLLRNAARGNQSCVAFQIQLGIAELSLSRPNGSMVDATKYDTVQIITKEVLLSASVRPPNGQPATKNLKAVLQRARVKDEAGKTVMGRWIVAGIGPA